MKKKSTPPGKGEHPTASSHLNSNGQAKLATANKADTKESLDDDDDEGLAAMAAMDAACAQGDSDEGPYLRPKSNTPHSSIVRQSDRPPPAYNPFPRSSREKLFKNPNLEVNLDAANWTNPDEIMCILDDQYHDRGDVDLTRCSIREALEWLTKSKHKISEDGLRFRHPSVRAIECILIMSYYFHADRVCRCKTEASNGKRYPCSRRRFCAFCSWRHGFKQAELFLPSFNANRGRIHAVTFSWRFGKEEVGIPFSCLKEAEHAELLWDVSKECLKALASSGCSAKGTIFVESLACTHLLPLRVNPHNHGLIVCGKSELSEYKHEVESAVNDIPDFRELSKLYPGLRPDLQFDLLKADTDCARSLNYCFAAFGFAKPGSSLDERYREAWTRCRTEDDRVSLNEEVAELVGLFEHITDSRRRYLKTGVFFHSTKKGNLTVRMSPEVRWYLNDLMKRVENEDKDKKSR